MLRDLSLHLQKCIALSLQQRTLHEEISSRTGEQRLTNCRGKSQGSAQTVLSPVEVITFFYFFPLQVKLKYLTTKLILLQTFHFYKVRGCLSMQQSDITVMGNAETLAWVYNLKTETSSRKQKNP